MEAGLESDDADRRRLRSLRPLNETTEVDDGLITHAEYQLFVDERRAQGHKHHAPHWLNSQFPIGLARAPLVGIQPLDAEAFCQWLTGRESGAQRYRLPWTGELAQGWKQTAGFWTAGEDNRFTLEGFATMHTENVAVVLSNLIDEDRARDRDLARDRARGRLKDPDFSPAWRQASKTARLSTRLRALVFAGALYEAQQKLTRSKKAAAQPWIDAYLDLYIDLLILEGRIEGTLQAFEGIRIVRERT